MNHATHKQISHKKLDTLFLLYEPGHVEELEGFFREKPKERDGSLIVALSLDVEEKLIQKGIPFSSGKKYQKIDSNQLEHEDVMIKTFFADARWGKYIYRDILLTKTFQFMFRAYVQRIWYYSKIIIAICEKYPTVKKTVGFNPSGVILPTSGMLAEKESRVVVDCVENISRERNLQNIVVPSVASRVTVRNLISSFSFKTRRVLFVFFLAGWNTVITLVKTPRHPRFIISDYWKNVGSSIELLKKGECIFLDRTEIKNINWRMLLRHRMRFVHSENFLSRKMRIHIKEESKKFNKIWTEMRKGMKPVFIWRDNSFDELLKDGIDNIFNNLEKILLEIEGTYALYKKIQPDIILLRASVSAQTHFSILPLVAKQCDIPSVELQHGLEYLGPGSWSREHTAEHIAVYGPLIKREFISAGYEGDKIWEIGSPRFDNYLIEKDRNIRKKHGDKYLILCIAPDIRPFEIYDSYSAEIYFRSVARAFSSLKEGHIIIKLRSGFAYEELFRKIIARTFIDGTYTIEQYKPLSVLYKHADMVISCFSTAILEAFQYDIPVIIPILNQIDEAVVRFHFSQYSEIDGLYIVSTDQEFNTVLQKRATHPYEMNDVKKRISIFMKKNFCFDGNGSKRYADLIVKLSKEANTHTKK